MGSVLREKWRLDRLLGVGGMAAVYEATHRNGKRGAVKLLHPAIAHDADARSRFLREGYVANRIGHPGVVAVLDDDTIEDGGVFLVMELLHGQSVDALLESRPSRSLDPRMAVDITCQLLDVLHAAHAQGVVHRDIKPENLFLTRENRVKVLDFGIARLRDQPNDSRTQTGSVMGTPAFMPPEQALGDWNRVDHRTDLWAAGATLFTMLTGRLVHEAETVNKLLLAAMTKPAPALASVLPGVHPALARIVDKALAVAPEGRFQSALEMRLALLSLHDEAPATIAPSQAINLALASTVADPTSGQPMTSLAGVAPVLVTLAVPVGDSWTPPRAPREGTLSAASRSATLTRPPAKRSYVAAGLLTGLVLSASAGFFIWKLNGSASAPGSSSGLAPDRVEAQAPDAPVVAPAVPSAALSIASPASPDPGASADLAVTASASASAAVVRPPAARIFAPRAPTSRPAEVTATARPTGNFDGRY